MSGLDTVTRAQLATIIATAVREPVTRAQLATLIATAVKEPVFSIKCSKFAGLYVVTVATQKSFKSYNVML